MKSLLFLFRFRFLKTNRFSFSFSFYKTKMNYFRFYFRFRNENRSGFDDEDWVSGPASSSLGVDVGRLSLEKFSSWSDGDSRQAVFRRRIADLEHIEEHLRRQVCYKKPSYRWRTTRRRIGQILRLLPTTLLFDAVNEGDLLELSGSYLVWGKLEWLGYNLVKVAWWSTQSFGHNTSTWQTDRHTDRHIVIANGRHSRHFGYLPVSVVMLFIMLLTYLL